MRQRSRESGVATELIATQSELTALVGAGPPGRDPAAGCALAGWRASFVGEELSDLIEGRRQVVVRPDGSSPWRNAQRAGT